MNRLRTLRICLLVTFIFAVMAASVSLLDSLYWFGWWAFIATMSFIGQDLAGWLYVRRLEEYEEGVWWRRELEELP